MKDSKVTMCSLNKAAPLARPHPMRNNSFQVCHLIACEIVRWLQAFAASRAVISKEESPSLLTTSRVLAIGCLSHICLNIAFSMLSIFNVYYMYLLPAQLVRQCAPKITKTDLSKILIDGEELPMAFSFIEDWEKLEQYGVVEKCNSCYEKLGILTIN